MDGGVNTQRGGSGALVPTAAGSGGVGIWILEVHSPMSCCVCWVLRVCFWHLFCYSRVNESCNWISKLQHIFQIINSFTKELNVLNLMQGVSPIAKKSSLTFMAVLADVSMNSRPVSSAYVWASFVTQRRTRRQLSFSLEGFNELDVVLNGLTRGGLL